MYALFVDYGGKKMDHILLEKKLKMNGNGYVKKKKKDFQVYEDDN